MVPCPLLPLFATLVDLGLRALAWRHFPLCHDPGNDDGMFLSGEKLLSKEKAACRMAPRRKGTSSAKARCGRSHAVQRCVDQS